NPESLDSIKQTDADIVEEFLRGREMKNSESLDSMQQASIDLIERTLEGDSFESLRAINELKGRNSSRIVIGIDVIEAQPSNIFYGENYLIVPMDVIKKSNVQNYAILRNIDTISNKLEFLVVINGIVKTTGEFSYSKY
ncbi:MAG: hypothetical protein AAF806_31555, partial [Bacteroidota bacterium]